MNQLLLQSALYASFLLGADEAAVDYARQIKPILSDRCYACHGPDEGQRKAELRLDLRTGAVDSAIVPGDAPESELIARITSNDPEEKMPPSASKKPALSEAEIDLLRRWIDQGAKFDEHWSYARLTRPSLPTAPDKSWPINDIDHFVAAGHQANNFLPSAEADSRTLVRRLSFDLLGLPPTMKQVEDYTANQSPAAYEKFVNQLLKSEHYGERMAMYWFDLVRYADTNGVHGDNHRDHALYREWVINAFNTNMPFDQFTVEQLAGDLIPNPTKQQRIASGYNRLNLTTREGGAQAKEYIAKYAADRVRNASVVWLGTTLGCCQCHNHKFDPFTQKDFYSFAAFFADIQEIPVGKQNPTKIPTDEQEQQVKQFDAQLASVRKVLATQTPQLSEAQKKWEEQVLADVTDNRSAWSIVTPTKTESSGGAAFAVQDDQSVLTSGKNPAKDTYSITLKTNQEKITAIRLEALTHPSLKNQSLSRGNGNFVLTRFEVELSTGSESKPIKIKSAVADFSQNGHPIKNAIDGKVGTGWAVEGHIKKANRKAVFTLAEQITGGTDTTITVRMRHESQYPQHNIGRFRLALTSADKPTLNDQDGLPNAILEVIKTPREKRSAKQNGQLADHFRKSTPLLAPQRNQLADLEKKRKAVVDSFRPILVSTAVKPRMMRILPRGNWLDDSGEMVQPSVPEYLGSLDITDRRATRMDLANWFTDPSNPLVARVFVNRLWKLFFGNGLVTSLDDFGAQGTVPSHPELLDWLAVEFIESGWDVRHMVKLMVMSKTYRQSSLEQKELRKRDPTNVWLSRQNRFRLDAEFVRDNALSIGGLLVHKIGGTSVKPYQPAGYWAHLNFPKRKWVHDKGDSQYRRGMYTYWCRTFTHPSLLAFDATNREETCVSRPRSNTPLQALVLLNDPTYVEAARAFATRIISEGEGSIDVRLDFAYREALNRMPTTKERQILAMLYKKHFDQYKAAEPSAIEVLSVGESKTPEDINTVELAAWTSVARVILNLHETITRY